jgi:flavodoxin
MRRIEELKMKKIIFMALCLAEIAASAFAQTGNNKVLIAYFSVPEPGSIAKGAPAAGLLVNGVLEGNTQYIAQQIQKDLQAKGISGSLFRIETTEPYPPTHEAILQRAAKEQNDNARPTLKNHIANIAQYDTIFVGYPTWDYDLPMALYTFFDEYDFSGKTIVLFNTHGGSSFNGTDRKIAKMEPKARVIKGISVSRNRIARSDKDVHKWVSSLRLNAK